MRIQRHYEQTQACRPTDPGRQASPVPTRRSGPRAIAVAALTAAALAAGSAPALAQPVQPLRPVQHLSAAEQASDGSRRVHQALSAPKAERAIDAAESQKGTPYVWGGESPRGFDCSGLVQWAYQQAGVGLPRIAHDQSRAGTRIPYSEARRGDLLYWANSGGYAYHVAIYLGDGRMIDAPRSGDHVRERDVHHYNLGGAVRL
ncbi:MULTISPECIES: C40 family peptidase [Nocardiopsis]|uniref:Glycoside hydrolase n=1 Tax=Nocardiopsis sinuspersici TaxID=501010 RepID=A0A1V3C7H8_9ACTN|nr:MULTISPECIES: C40 family peptidase [Nocardiopsis]OOC56618.1 glycoside hydrolase [Nocardiopsis sinuspersici]